MEERNDTLTVELSSELLDQIEREAERRSAIGPPVDASDLMVEALENDVSTE